MQETGNKQTSVDIQKILSIQLSLNGLSFSDTNIKELPDQADYQRVDVIIDTSQAVLVPAEIFEESMAESYLRLNGIEPKDDQCVVISPTSNWIVAIIVWQSDVINELKEKYSSKISFLSPLLSYTLTPLNNSLIINLTSTNAYMTLWQQSLKYVEVLPYSGANDTLYYIEKLRKQFNLRRSSISIIGHNALEVIKLVGKYHKL